MSPRSAFEEILLQQRTFYQLQFWRRRINGFYVWLSVETMIRVLVAGETLQFSSFYV